MTSSKSIMLVTALSALGFALPANNLVPRAPAVQLGFPKPGGQELGLTDRDLQQLTLVTVGRGVQNYTCPLDTTAPIQTKAGGGAIAQLFDVTTQMADNQHFIDTITNVAVGNPRPVLDDVPPDGSSGLGPLNEQFPKACFHHFDERGVPVFDCKQHGIIFGTKLESVSPPADVKTSANGAKAVAWLNLAAAAGSRDITKVIRVVTAGGSPPADCSGISHNDVISVDYAAQYWFFNNETKLP